MHKKRLILFVFVLGIPMSTWADIDQAQISQLFSSNSLLLDGTSGMILGDSTNIVSASALQEATSANGREFSVQYEDATLIQSALGAASDGINGVDQIGTGIAYQSQSGSDQTQTLTSSLETQSAVVGGEVAVSTLQGFVGNQVQATLTPYSASVNISSSSVIDSSYIRRNAAATIASYGVE